MPEESDGLTVCARLRKVIPDTCHLCCIEDAVTRVHRITFDCTELLALHVTRCLEEGRPLPVLTQDYVKMAMMEVSMGNGKRTNLDDDLTKTRITYMSSLVPVSRQRLDQLLMAQSISLAASIRTNLWFHFPRRVFRYVRALRKQELLDAGVPKKECTLRLLTMANSICNSDMADESSDDGTWVNQQRRFLGCNAFTHKSIESNGKHHTDVMLRATWLINRELEQRGEHCMSCMPIRRQFRPAFCNIDTKALCSLLHIPIPKGSGEFAKAKNDIWNGVLFMNRHVVRGVSKRNFAGSIRTDGVSVRLLFDKLPSKQSKKRKRTSNEHLTTVPVRGIYAIDQIKHLSRSYQVIGADPGKRELLVCVDAEHPSLPEVRYTAAQRREDTHVTVHAKQEVRRRPENLTEHITSLASYCSRSSSLTTQHNYFKRRRVFLDTAIEHYSKPWHRKRHWERHIRSQKSLTDFVRRILSLQHDNDVPIALAYGSWGSVAGRPGAPCNKGSAPCIGRGLRQKLSRHFLILNTPEQYTSKTCSLCGSECGPCEEVDSYHRSRLLTTSMSESETRHASRFSVRGLRHCYNDCCAAHLNRDHNAAVNIHRRCKSLLSGDTGSLNRDPVDSALESLNVWMTHGI